MDALQVAFWRFDTEGAVINYDAWLPNLQAFASSAYGLGHGYYGFPAAVQAPMISQLCQATQINCVGGNQQYANQSECESVLGAKDFGNQDEAWGDNIVCRMIHIVLTTYRPDVHCPHVVSITTMPTVTLYAKIS